MTHEEKKVRLRELLQQIDKARDEMEGLVAELQQDQADLDKLLKQAAREL